MLPRHDLLVKSVLQNGALKLARQAKLDLGILALRQQLMVLERQCKKPRFSEADRFFWVVYSKLSDQWKSFLKLARPRTVTDWQQNRFREFWTRLWRP